jgi:ABC-type branched-subunit amino acid transport system permease subunit
MGIILFILIAGAWAAFLLPSFFDHRRENPRATTRAFARSKEMLANVTSAQVGSPAYAKHHAQMRRQRIFVALLLTALVTLVIAVLRGSVTWLGIAIVVDMAVGGYVAMILASKQPQTVRRAPVVPIPTQIPAAPTTAAELDLDAAPPTVRVIAG